MLFIYSENMHNSLYTISKFPGANMHLTGHIHNFLLQVYFLLHALH